MLTHTFYNAFQCVSLFHFFEKKIYIYNIFAENFMSNIPQSSKAEARMVIKDVQTQETIP